MKVKPANKKSKVDDRGGLVRLGGDFENIEKIDPESAGIIKKERDRQTLGIELIASENFVSRAVMEAQSSVMTNKYAEGYPGKRYYGGCKWYDEMESLAIERAKKLFSAEHANVQPHSGVQANMAVYFSVLKYGDTVMAMDMAHGGHLSHGSPVSFSGKFYNFVHYTVDKSTELIDYDNVLKLAKIRKPKLIVCGASAYPRTIDFKIFREVCDEVGAYMMADIAHIAGLVVAGEHPNPFPHADFVTTTTQKTLRGPRGGIVLCKKEFAEIVDKTVFPGIQGGPFMHTIAAKAVAFKEAMSNEFKEYQRQIIKNAKALAYSLQKNAFRLVSGGTDNHLMLVDLTSKNITGKETQILLEEVDITVNKNMIPFDSKPPLITSGIRVGTPAVTTRGMKEQEMGEIGDMIARTVEMRSDEKTKEIIRNRVVSLCQKFPLY